jgi:energy-coupling factor transport system permease protein
MSRLPRAVHPGAWWLWALALAAAASQTTDPVLLALILAVVVTVVVHRRGDAPWARGFRAYLILALVVVGIRMLFRMVLGGTYGDHVLVTLPELQLPAAAAGIRLGGPVTAEGLLAALYDGMRLATMLVCIGAAQALANPRRLLKAVPGALYEVGSAIVVALSVAPQLVESVGRVRRARRLRGAPTRGLRGLKAILVPVLEDALDRSLALAAAMDSRGYGRTGPAPRRERLLTGTLVIGGLLAVCVGLYGLLDGTAPRGLGLPMLLAGTVVAAAGFLRGGRNVARTIHRPDPWTSVEWAVVGSGLVVAAVLFAMSSAHPAALHPTLVPLTWPDLAVVPALAVLAGLVPAWLTPPPPAAMRTATRPAMGGPA